MTNALLAFAEKEGNIIVTDVESGAETVINLLKTDATNVWTWLKNENAAPAVQSFYAQAIANGEAALADLAKVGNTLGQGIITNGVADAETLALNALQSALGGTSVATLLTPLAQAGVTALGSAFELIAQAGLAKALASLVPAAAALAAEL